MKKYSGEYNRREILRNFFAKTARSIPKIFWVLHMLPLFVLMILFSGLAILLTLPLSLVVWLFVGDRPVRRMQPTNFFYMIFRGILEGGQANYVEMPLNLETESAFMRIVYQLSVDYKIDSEFHYKSIIDFFILGKSHPALNRSYPLPARAAGLAVCALATWYHPALWIPRLVNDVKPEALSYFLIRGGAYLADAVKVFFS